MYLFLTTVAFGEEPRSSTFKASSIVFQDSGGLSIKADKAIWNLKKKSGELSGGVVLLQDKLKLTADSITLSLDSENKIVSIKATSDVNIVHGLQKATSGSAYWNLARNELKLEMEPSIQSPEGLFSGGTIYYWPQKEEIQCSVGCSLTLYEKK